jgi:PAS domain S-box-containing protein
MRQSFIALYSAIGTQAATALLLACALWLLNRMYPRPYLRLWSASWLAASLNIAFGLTALIIRTRITPSDGVAFVRAGQALPTAATWLAQSNGYLAAMLLLLGAWSLARDRAVSRRRIIEVAVIAMTFALIPTFGVPTDLSPEATTTRLLMRVAMLNTSAAVATLGAAALVRASRRRYRGLGPNWVWTVLVLLAGHRLLTVALAFSSYPLARGVSSELFQLMPLADILLMAALGIGIALALVEEEKAQIRTVAERQLDAERLARTSGASLVSALAAVTDLVAVITPDGTMRSWNPAFEAFTRTHGGQVPRVGMPIDALLALGETSDGTSRVSALLHGQDQLFEITFAQDDARLEAFDVSARPLRDNGELAGAVIVARDVTERRKLEQQLQQAQRLDTVGRLAGGIAHDFNNLLTAILSSTSMARDSLPAEHEVQADLADVQLAGERATQLTKQLLAFARRQPVSQQPLELNDRVATMERMLSRLVGPDVTLRVALGDGLWPVRADGPQLEQVLVNVVVNARDAMPAGGRLTIRTENRTITAEAAAVLPRPMPAGDYVAIVVADTGIGMDAQTLAHVFEPFYTTKPVGQGTGLGLAMCYGIIRQHHGVIWIDSAPGRGSSVNLLLPRYEGPMSSRTERRGVTTPVSSTGGSETVLLVEDEPQVRAVAARALRSAGYRVLESTNGRDGLQVARRERGAIDLIVSDVVMPEMGGKEMVELARQFAPKAAVLFVSGYTAGSFPAPAEDPAARMFLQKPFTPQELLERVRAVLDRRATPEDLREPTAAP